GGGRSDTSRRISVEMTYTARAERPALHGDIHWYRNDDGWLVSIGPQYGHGASLEDALTELVHRLRTESIGAVSSGTDDRGKAIAERLLLPNYASDEAKTDIAYLQERAEQDGFLIASLLTDLKE